MKRPHLIKDISFRSDYLVCSCEARMRPDEFSQHRASVGAPQRGLDAAAYSPDRSGDWSQTITVNDNRPLRRPNKGRGITIRPQRRVDTDRVCPEGHTGRYATDKRGWLFCQECRRVAEAERRARERGSEAA